MSCSDFMTARDSIISALWESERTRPYFLDSKKPSCWFWCIFVFVCCLILMVQAAWGVMFCCSSCSPQIPFTVTKQAILLKHLKLSIRAKLNKLKQKTTSRAFQPQSQLPKLLLEYAPKWWKENKGNALKKCLSTGPSWQSKVFKQKSSCASESCLPKPCFSLLVTQYMAKKLFSPSSPIQWQVAAFLEKAWMSTISSSGDGFSGRGSLKQGAESKTQLANLWSKTISDGFGP